MPKKKLTKAQYNRKIKLIWKNIGDLFIDKTYHGSDSFVGPSTKTLSELVAKFARLMK
jgi:hypothetical protein